MLIPFRDVVRCFLFALCLVSAALLTGCSTCGTCGSCDEKQPAQPAAKPAAASPVATPEKPQEKNETISLFDGKTLGKWKATNFGGEGEVEVKDGQMTIRMGSPLSGVTWQGEPPLKINYEISLEAKRVEGDDFFLALTVPVKDDHI